MNDDNQNDSASQTKEKELEKQNERLQEEKLNLWEKIAQLSDQLEKAEEDAEKGWDMVETLKLLAKKIGK